MCFGFEIFSGRKEQSMTNYSCWNMNCVKSRLGWHIIPETVSIVVILVCWTNSYILEVAILRRTIEPSEFALSLLIALLAWIYCECVCGHNHTFGQKIINSRYSAKIDEKKLAKLERERERAEQRAKQECQMTPITMILNVSVFHVS